MDRIAELFGAEPAEFKKRKEHKLERQPSFRYSRRKPKPRQPEPSIQECLKGEVAPPAFCEEESDSGTAARVWEGDITEFAEQLDVRKQTNW